MLITDHQVRQQVLAGNTEAFSTLVEKYQKNIFRIVFRRIGDRALSEDITQEAFIKAYKALHTLREEDSFSAWLTRIALNVTYDKLRSIQSRAEVELKQESYHTEGFSSPYLALEMKQKMERFKSALFSLKSHYMSVVSLNIFEGKSYIEIAEMLNIPTGTVASRMNKAVEIMRRKIFGKGSNEEEVA